MIRRIRPWTPHPLPGIGDQTAVAELGRFLTAGDVDGIRSLVAPDVVLVIDSGGTVLESGSTLEGAGPTSIALAALAAPGGSVAAASINGRPGLVLDRDDLVVAVITAEMRAGLLSTVWVVSSTAKLRHWNT